MNDEAWQTEFQTLVHAHADAIRQLSPLRRGMKQGRCEIAEFLAILIKEKRARRQLIGWSAPNKSAALDRLLYLLSAVLRSGEALDDDELAILKSQALQWATLQVPVTELQSRSHVHPGDDKTN